MAAMLMSRSAESQTSDAGIFRGRKHRSLTVEHREPEQFAFVETSKKPSET